MINIAAIIDDLSMSQKSFYLIKEFNKCISNTDISTGIFYNRISTPPIEPLFACKNVAFLGSYQGVIISTTAQEAEITLKTANNSKRFLYLWDMDWTMKPVDFDKYMSILRDDRLRIIARSQSHVDCIENFCNKNVVGIVDNWDIDSLMEITR